MLWHSTERVQFPSFNHGGSANPGWGGRPDLVAAEVRRFLTDHAGAPRRAGDA